MSPMTILRQSPTDPKWFEDNVNDFSLSSFLGQLDSTCDAEKRRKSPNRDVSSKKNVRNDVTSSSHIYILHGQGRCGGKNRHFYQFNFRLIAAIYRQ